MTAWGTSGSELEVLQHVLTQSEDIEVTKNSVALSVIGHVGDVVPSFGRSKARAVSVGCRRPLQPNVCQMPILLADVVLECCGEGFAGKSRIRECLVLVPVPTHALYLAPQPKTQARRLEAPRACVVYGYQAERRIPRLRPMELFRSMSRSASDRPPHTP